MEWAEKKREKLFTIGPGIGAKQADHEGHAVYSIPFRLLGHIMVSHPLSDPRIPHKTIWFWLQRVGCSGYAGSNNSFADNVYFWL